jgi:hypothetical protein
MKRKARKDLKRPSVKGGISSRATTNAQKLVE